MAANPKNKGKVVDATTTATWAVNNEQFRRLARTGEFAPQTAEEPEGPEAARKSTREGREP